MTVNPGYPASSSVTDPLIGKTIGDFEVLAEIGRGGMGVVYRARQISLDRIVALKILSRQIGLAEQAIARFRREAQATAKLYHPFIVPIYAQGQEGQTHYYAMQLVSGTSLHDILVGMRGSARTPDAGAATVSTTPNCPWQKETGTSQGVVFDIENAEALGASPLLPQAPNEDFALAETALIDRGSGPGGGDSGAGESEGAAAGGSAGGVAGGAAATRYTDTYFDEIARQIHGIADALDFAHRHGVIHRDIKPHNLLVGEQGRLCLSDFGLARVLEQPGMTMTGEFVGSPLYMSPEQISGRIGKIGPQTDIYSLGATLYEWLTLRPPFLGQTREEVIAQVITAEVVPPRQINPGVPVDLETICLKAMEKNLRRRYPSAAAMRDDLQRYLERARIKARRDGPFVTMAKLISRRPVEATVVVAVVLVLALSALLFRERRHMRASEHVIAEKQHQVEAAVEENQRLQQERNELAGALEFGKRLADELNLPGLLSSGPEKRADKYQAVGDAQRIGAMFLTSLRESEARRLSGLDPAGVDSRYLQALSGKQSAAEALALLGESLAVNPALVEARVLRAWIKCQLGDTEAMLAEAEDILRIDPRRTEGLVVRAAAHLLRGEYELARSGVAEAQQAQRGDYRLDVLLGQALARLGRNDAASAALGRALTLAPDCVLAMLLRAEVSQAAGLHEYAVADLTRVLEIEPRNAEALEHRGECFDQLQRYDEAHDDYLNAAAISGGSVSLYIKLVAAAANRDQQRIDRETKEAQQRPKDREGEASPLPVLPPPGDPGAVQQWLKRYLERQGSDSNGAASSGRRLELRFVR